MMARAFALIAGVLALAACSDPPPQPSAVRPVRVARVSYGAIDELRTYTGTIQPRYQADHAFRVGGRIVARFVDVGATVAADEIVARLDPADYRLALEAAEAELAAASADAMQTGADRGRSAELNARGWVSHAEYERRAAAAEMARGRLERARRQVALARNRLAYTELRADAAGTVTEVLAEAGQVVGEGQVVLRIARPDEREVLVAIPENQLELLRTAEARVTLWSSPGRSYAAALREVAPSADPATRTYAVRFSLSDPDRSVALGQTATVALGRRSAAAFAALPMTALYQRGGGAAVWVVGEAGRLRLVPVEVERFRQETVLIRGGVPEGALVVTAGVHKLDESVTVRVAELRP